MTAHRHAVRAVWLARYLTFASDEPRTEADSTRSSCVWPAAGEGIQEPSNRTAAPMASPRLMQRERSAHLTVETGDSGGCRAPTGPVGGQDSLDRGGRGAVGQGDEVGRLHGAD